MGDRGNIVVVDGDKPPVVFYTHWNGTEVAQTVWRTLDRRARWDDPSYLARMLFCQLLDGDDGDTGFGISTGWVDNEHSVVVVAVGEQRFYVCACEATDDTPENFAKHQLKSWSFEEFAKLSEKEVEDVERLAGLVTDEEDG